MHDKGAQRTVPFHLPLAPHPYYDTLKMLRTLCKVYVHMKVIQKETVLQASGCQEACNCAGSAAVCPAAVILPVLCGGLSPQQHPEGVPAAEATQRLSKIAPPLREAHRRTEEVAAFHNAKCSALQLFVCLVRAVKQTANCTDCPI